MVSSFKGQPQGEEPAEEPETEQKGEGGMGECVVTEATQKGQLGRAQSAVLGGGGWDGNGVTARPAGQGSRGISSPPTYGAWL